MMENRYILMIHQHLRGALNETDQATLEAWLEEAPEHRETYRALEKSWKLSQQYRAEYRPDVEAGLQALRTRIAADKMQPSIQPSRKRKQPFRYAHAIAAGLLVLITAAAVWNFWLREATLLIAVTAANEQQHIALSDGSVVTLNENSTLRYPGSFQRERNVELEGEAFFEVSSDPGQIFVVTTPKTRTEVLGTRFNLRAYRDESYTEVEVVEGIVRLGALSNEQVVELQQGARGTFRHEDEIIASDQPKTLNATFWKDRRLRFQHHELSEVISEINHRLNLQIQLRNDAIADCPLTLGIPIQHPDTLVAILADTYSADWQKIAPNSYTIDGGTCAGD